MDRPEVIPDDPRYPDVRDTEWYRTVQAIEDLCHDGAHGWAEATLTGIQDTIARTHVVTARQRRALTNIAQRCEWAPGRAYDIWGYGRRWH